ncbi:NAD P-binding protein [Gloeophyllum trabeum ATCC 11539]|uniref:NAD P-binding protein n=1 Tax=Gloeophyllum trabeum (strain ATCC 11539 / FP-39264 / Madison 617) TaxID=670483 RepID=S7Q2B2_GLOTA|nr:NAD P-binding protein [Gloeophyllum trabeum ATCC 11539]EPQ53687.1 NAD P-binding protein [Gloeophyllum trabeum ATCC 11539]
MLWRLWASPNGINRYKHGQESWALVTGASDGIGKACVPFLPASSVAKALAQKGFHVLLHGRNPTKLTAVRSELAAECPNAQFEIVVADATKSALAREVAEACKGRTVTILVNNAGYTSTLIQPLETQDYDAVQRGIDIGCSWTTQLTRALLPQLRADAPAAVVNVGSYVARHPPPFLAVYAGTKGYMLAFSRALRTELALLSPSPISVQYHEIHSVATKANGSPVSLAAPHPDVMARAIIVAIGRDKEYVTPYWVHELTSWVLRVLPERVVARMAGGILQGQRTDIKRGEGEEAGGVGE